MNSASMRFLKQHFLILLLTFIGAILHFYNLNWGAPFYFHPDERNIASSVSQLQFPDQMHPHFFAYGSLPIYVIYFTGLLINSLTTNHQSLITNFEQAIILSRFYSALFATTLIPIMYFLGKTLYNRHSGEEERRLQNPSYTNHDKERFWTSQNDERAGLIAAFLATTSIGFLQFAHFGTFEMWLTFFSVLLFWICLQQLTKKNILLLGLCFGTLVAIKISSFVLLPLLFLVVATKEGTKKIRHKFGLRIIEIVINFILFLIPAFLVYFLTNPFVFVDTKSFLDTINYESSLAIGTLLVFYTGEFFNTIPILFQFTNVYPFLLNPLLTNLFIPSFLYLSFVAIKTRNKSYILFIIFYLILFLSQAFLFVKWTRYMVPTLPFIFLIISFALISLMKNSNETIAKKILFASFIAINFLFAISYFITAFVRPDTRIAAYQFAQKIIPFEAPILSEVYDLGIVPFNGSFTNISLFNFYELDNNSPDATPEALQKKLVNSEYIILPSQRIIKPRLKNSEKFPHGNTFYTNLLHGNLGYQKIYETPCDLFCNITYLANQTFRFEGTANVFDRPTVMIFKKTDTVYTKK